MNTHINIVPAIIPTDLTADDLTPTLSMGLSIEHLVSMIAPGIAGLIWIHYGYYWVFIIAAGVGVISAMLSLKIRVPGQ